MCGANPHQNNKKGVKILARVSSLKIGDEVEFCGKSCKVIDILKGSSIIAVQCGGEKGFISYIYAKDCKKII